MNKLTGTLYIDTREPNYIKELIPKFFEEYEPKLKCVVKELPVGDFQYENILIERKEINDFYQSIIEQRLLIQTMKLAMKIGEGYRPYVLIHGKPSDVYDNKLTQRMYYGQIASLNAHNIHTVNICNHNFESMAELIYALIRKEVDPKPLKMPIIEPFGYTWTEKALKCIPHIGEKTAKDIAENVSQNMRNYFEWDEDYLRERLLKVDGVGEKTAEIVIKTMRG